MSTELWIAVIVIGVLTYITRAVPFLMRLAGNIAPAARAWLSALGPCLLSAMATVVFLDGFQTSIQIGKIIPFLVGSVFASVSMSVRPDPGIGTVAGVTGWWLAASIGSVPTF
ncbi:MULTISPECIES: AzlD domain-containing protein [Brucella]|uniref:AzlD domain-containing protein n=1 Tax=Brucella melitensis TaxID=29459 RepID=A0AB36PQJ8_BRUML|nr:MULTISPECIES: AzlD domain-containing protein [Brucella]AQQ56115.1 hypothetical protein ADS42_002865 [Brucella melitensis]ARX99925.1 hypothetical protein BK201_09455 [Brucella melitensis]ARY03112.1 hypothetical protein BK186_09465 [Brucella melitensis]ARY06292.1 hypothetical protein BK218_09460 [Brucella melitensis]ARY09450.1 hypothetical protein BK189_09455 [Brucella melitensis]